VADFTNVFMTPVLDVNSMPEDFSAVTFVDGKNVIIVYNPAKSFLKFGEIYAHELTHAATIKALQNPKPTQKEQELKERLTELRDIFLQYVKTNNLDLETIMQGTEIPKGAKDNEAIFPIAEFVANLSNPKFAEVASAIPVKNSNLLSRVLQAIFEFLGLSESNVYDMTLAALKLYLDPSTTTAPVTLSFDLVATFTDPILLEQAKEIIASTDLSDSEKSTKIAELAKFQQEMIQDQTGDEFWALEKSAIDIIQEIREYTPEGGKTVLQALFPEATTSESVTKDVFKYAQEFPKGPDPSKFRSIMKPFQALAKAAINRLPLYYEGVLLEVINSMWNKVLTIEEKNQLFVQLANKGMIGRNAGAIEMQKVLAELITYEKDLPIMVDLLRNRIEALTTFVNANWKGFVDNLNEMPKNEDYKFSAPNMNVKTAAFMQANFGSVINFRIARNLMYDALHAFLNNHVEGNFLSETKLMLSKEEMITSALDSLKNQRRTLARKEGKTEIEHKSLSALDALLKQDKEGKELFFTLLELVYPNASVIGKEEIEFFSELESFVLNDTASDSEGLKNETEDSSLVDEEARLSDSIKEFLSFLPNPFKPSNLASKDKYIHPSHTFVVATQLILENFDLNNLDNWQKQKRANDGQFASLDKVIMAKLDQLVHDAQGAQKNPSVRFHIIESKFNGSRIRVVKDANLVNESYASPKLQNAEYIYNHIGSYRSLYKKLLADGIVTNIKEFNEQMAAANARNTLRELKNSIGSLVEKRYMIAVKRFVPVPSKKDPETGMKFSYVEASGYGIEKSYLSYVRANLEAIHLKQGFASVALSEDVKEAERLKAVDPARAANLYIKAFKLTDVFEPIKPNMNRNSTVLNVITEFGFFTKRAMQLKPAEDLDEFLNDSFSLMAALSKLAKEQSLSLRPTSILNGDKNSMYKFSASSYFYKIVEYFTKSKDSEVLGSTGRLEFMAENRPEHLETDFFSNNIFVKGINKIHGHAEHDSSNNKSTGTVKTFTNENSAHFESRAFSFAFLDMLRSNSNGKYINFLYQPSDKPRIPGVEVNVLTKAQVKEGLKAAVRQVKTPLNLSSILGVTKKKNLMFSLYDKAVEQLGENATEDALVDNIMSQLELKAVEYMNQLLDNNAEFAPNIEALYGSIFGIKSVGAQLRQELKVPDTLPKSIAVRKSNPKYNEEEIAKYYQPLVTLFVMNEYVNSYHLNQLFTGPYNLYKSEDDIVKRMAGILAPGKSPLVGESVGGMKEKFRMGVINDRKRGKAVIEAFLKDLIPDITPERLEEMLGFFEDFKSTDAQGFMSAQRWADLHNGYGAAYGLGKVNKPVYFGNSIQETTAGEDSENVMEPRPAYVKYSSVVLSKELIDNFPEFQKVNEYMTKNELDELVFNSALKVGNPPAGAMNTVDGLGNVEANPLSVLSLNNADYKLQFNAKAKVDKKVSLFTQLTYFLNILETNTEAATEVYRALNFLFREGLDEFNETDLRRKLTSSLTSPGSEVVQDLLKAGISFMNPLVAPKVISQLSAIMEKFTVAVKFKGAKLVLQAEEYTGKYNNPNFPKRDKPLRYVKTANSYYAESFVPKGMLDPELEAAVRRGEEIFLTADMFGFRLPSTELHSAIPLKVVGIYDSQDTNVIIVPFQVVYLHGSDFDVDTLTVVVREKFTKGEKLLLGDIATDYVGYEKKGGKYVFKKELYSEYQMYFDLKLAGIDERNTKERALVEKAWKEIQQKFAKAIIIENVLSIITDPKNRDRVLVPITMSVFNNPENPESALYKLRQDGIDSSLGIDTDLSLVNNRYTAFASMQDGARLTGIFANAMKALGYLATGSPDKGRPFVKPELAWQMEVGGKVLDFNQLQNEDLQSGHSSWQYLDGLVNLAIDNLKEKGLYPLGINIKTGNVLVAMLALGMPLYEAVKILQLPEIKDINKFNVYNQQKEIKDQIAALRKQLKEGEEIPLLSDTGLAAVVKGEGSIAERIAALEIYQKAHLIGEDIGELATSLKILRSFPSTVTDIVKLDTKLGGIFTGIQQQKLPTSDTRSPFEGNTSKAVLRDSFAFDAPLFVQENPHIGASIDIHNNLMYTISTNVQIYGPKYMSMVTRLLPHFDSWGENKMDKATLLEELSKYFASAVMYEKLHDPKIYDPAARSYEYGPMYYAKLLKEYITAARTEDVRASRLGLKELNRLVESTEIASFGDLTQARLTGLGKVLFDDLQELRENFYELSKFVWNKETKKFTFDPEGNDTTIQDAIVDFAMIFEGLKFKSSSLSSKIPYDKITDQDSQYNLLVVKGTERIDQIADNFELNLMITNIKKVQVADTSIRARNRVQFVERPQNTKKFNSPYAGFEEGVGYFDREIELKLNEKGEMPEPMKWFRTEFRDREERRVDNTLYVLMGTVAGVTKEGIPIARALYKRIAARETHVMVPDLRIEDFEFAIKVRPLKERYGFEYMTHQVRNPALNDVSLRVKIDVGEKFYIYNALDVFRTQARIVRVLEVEEKDSVDAKGNSYKEYVHKVETADSETKDVYFAVERNPNDPPGLQDLKEYSNTASLPSEDSKFYIKGGEQLTRINEAVSGALNFFRPRPFTDDAYDWASTQAAKWFEGAEKGTRRNTDRGTNLTEEEYEAILRGQQNELQSKGSLMHAYMQLAVTQSEEEQAKIRQRISDLEIKGNLPEGTYKWVTENDFYKDIYRKMGVNTFDAVPEEDKDRIVPEFTVHSSLLDMAGTVDIMVYHPDNLLSLIEMKSGWGFNKETNNMILRWGSSEDMLISQSPRNMAKLQVMLYAFLLKTEKPDVRFRDLKIAWVPSKENALLYDHRAKVEVKPFLEMIEKVMKYEMKKGDKSMYDYLQSKMSKENFRKLFDPKEYDASSTTAAKSVLQDRAIKAQLETDMEQLRALVLYDHEKQFSEQKTLNVNKAAELFDKILKYQDKIEGGLVGVQDISTMSLWLGSNANMKSAYLQYFDKNLKEAKQKANDRYNAIWRPFMEMRDVIVSDYEKAHGKSITEYIPGLKGKLNLYSSTRIWEWMYTDRIDASTGENLGKKMRTTEQEWAQAKIAYPELGEWETRRKLVDYMNKHYKAELTKVGGKAATVGIAIDRGDVSNVILSNLDLTNKQRLFKGYEKYEHYDGWFPKTYKMLEEHGTILNKSYREEFIKQNFTLHVEDTYEETFNEVEAIPIKYLGNKYIDSSENYSLNAEAQFDKMMRNLIYKDELDNIYTIGKAMQFYLQLKGDNRTGVDYSNTIKYLETAIEMQVRGRKWQLTKPLQHRQESGLRNEFGGMNRINWIKTIRSLKSAAAAPIMWLKPLAGTANGVFTYMVLLKEGLKGSLSTGAPMFGVDGDQVSFTVRDVAWASKEYFNMQKDAMMGKLRENKMFLLAKKFNYMPNAYDWSLDSTQYKTTRNHMFSSSTMYMFHRIPEEGIALITMAAQMRRMKTAGKSLWDRYNVEDVVDASGVTYKDVR